MKQIDFAGGKISHSILQAALPMLVAQLLNLLYNIVDRIYIARIPDIGTAALGGVGICFPVIVIITAFANLFGSGGAPLFSIERGKGEKEEAGRVMNTSFFLLVTTGTVLTVLGLLIARPLLFAFGASDASIAYALPYMRIYFLGTVFSMIATGMNPFINAQGYAQTGMLTVMIGAAVNIVLDPVFIFVFGLGVSGAALATILSQALSSLFVVQFLAKKAELRVRLLSFQEARQCTDRMKDIIGLGMAAFTMQLTNSLVSICCNNVLQRTGGDIYVSVMTIVSSVRQMVETPMYAITDGSSPVISFNYGAGKADRVRRAIWCMFFMCLAYGVLMWIVILTQPEFLISIFSSDASLRKDSIPSMGLYFSAFVFMVFQYSGQTVLKSLNKKKLAIFFSLLRKAFIVVPLTFLLPYVLHMGTDGVFLAEPISNVIGGTACFLTMLATVMPELSRMKREEAVKKQ
ncbi:MAG: MATE family efflux transporter [Lachnospiraceae bacterium]|nr:MATE family efflux transporter [Lachnospiraceae bacterium]